MKKSNDLNLIPGTFYNVDFGNGASNFTYNGSKPTLMFSQTVSCYDARFHGVDNPEDYVRYIFQLPRNLGIWSGYKFQILNVTPA